MVGWSIVTYSTVVLIHHELRRVYLCLGLVRSPLYGRRCAAAENLLAIFHPSFAGLLATLYLVLIAVRSNYFFLLLKNLKG